MAFVVLILSAFLLAPTILLDTVFLQIVLLFLFLGMGLFVHFKRFQAYLVFTFLFPLLPSQFPQISRFDFLEFIFLSFVFWWALFRIRNKNTRLPESSLNPILGVLVIVFCISMFLSLLRHNYIQSEVFLLTLKDNWNIFLPKFLLEPRSDSHFYLPPGRNCIFFS